MYESIIDSFWFYLDATTFTGLLLLLLICRIFKDNKNIKDNKLKKVLRISISTVLVCLWAWDLIYMNLYPISLAYYEYNHNIVEEKIGVIESIEQNVNDRMYITIGDTDYTVVYSNAVYFEYFGNDVVEGTKVRIQFGTKSKIIFDIAPFENTNDISPSS